MAHESFEDEQTARVLNEHFISIKVDREERPDIDHVYMAVCQALTGSGGWPASIFLTPEQKPFFAGTYFPPQPRYGTVGFQDLLRAVAQKWKQSQAELIRSAEQILGHLKTTDQKAGKINFSLPEAAAGLFLESFDRRYGGFGSAPKFPAAHNLLFLLVYASVKGEDTALEMAETTLTQMRRGGLFDQVGYGFSRYSTDRFFLAPHFEKMLYDNALLILAYTAGYAATGKQLYLDTAEKTALYIMREMTSLEGAFYSAQDADSNGVEGEYYLFDYDEILSLLGGDAGKEFCRAYGITEQGNFEGRNIPNRLHADEPAGPYSEALPMLYEYRKKRAKLHLDDKILTAWNALMITALSLLYRVTGSGVYLCAAQKAERFIGQKLAQGNKLFVSYRDSKRSGGGFLDDYAFYTAALLGLYEATSEQGYLKKAETFCREAVKQFSDADQGGFFLGGRENERLILTPKETYDGAMPSGNSAMTYNFVRLSQLNAEGGWDRLAEQQLAFLSAEAEDYPAGHSLFLLSLLLYENPPPRITVVLAEKSGWDAAKKQLPFYADVTVLNAPTEEYGLQNGQTTYYVCKGQTCLPPSNTL